MFSGVCVCVWLVGWLVFTDLEYIVLNLTLIFLGFLYHWNLFFFLIYFLNFLLLVFRNFFKFGYK